MKVIRAMIRGLAVFAMAFCSLSPSSAVAKEPADTTILSSATIVIVLQGNAENKPEVQEIAKGADRPETKEWMERVKDFKALFPKGQRFVWVINTNADPKDRMARAGQIFRIYPGDLILIKRQEYEWRKFLMPMTI